MLSLNDSFVLSQNISSSIHVHLQNLRFSNVTIIGESVHIITACHAKQCNNIIQSESKMRSLIELLQ